MSSIDYKLHEYNLPGGADYRARVQHQQTIDLDGVIKEMANHYTGISPAIMVAVFGEFLTTLIFLLVQGYKIETPFAVFSITIKGTFESPEDKFDPHRHTVEISIAPGDRLQNRFKAEARPRKRHLVLPQPTIDTCKPVNDLAAGALIPGRMASLHGRNLKFDLNDPQQGIFLTPVAGSEEPEPLGSPVRVEEVGHNKGRKLVFVTPADLPAGHYRLEVRARFGRHSLRSGQLSKVVVVQ